jgi:hypothetical protein
MTDLHPLTIDVLLNHWLRASRAVRPPNAVAVGWCADLDRYFRSLAEGQFQPPVNFIADSSEERFVDLLVKGKPERLKYQ